MNDILISGWRFKSLMASILAAAAAYLLASLYSGWDHVLNAVGRVGSGGIAAALCMSLINYAMRFIRWQMYLRVLGNEVPWWPNWWIYISGFSLTTTPGKAGEAIRAVFLKRFNVSYTDSLAALFSERLSDLVTVVVLATLGLRLYPQARGIELVFGAAILIAASLLTQEGWMRRLAARTEHHAGRLARVFHHLMHMLLQARQCYTWRPLAAGMLLGIVAWGAEALAFYWILQWLGLDLSLYFAVFVYAISMLAGAISALPGGLGGAEAAMVALLLLKGVSTPDAVAATVLIRLTTLWFAVGLGMGALGTSSKHGVRK
ncbi:MAG: lysylphosphatidylglycerol synthase transmembrane domain-containing protein [Gammaproteobacteria bacterium]